MKNRKYMINTAVILIILMFSIRAKASEPGHHIALQAVSYHFKKADERQAVHPGIGYEYSPSSSFGWQTGFFKDSFNYPSGYLGMNYSFKKTEIAGVPIRVIGAVNVLHKKFTKGGEGETRIVPFPIIEATIKDNISINLTGTPSLDYFDGKHTNGVVVIQLKLLWNK